MLSRNYDLKFNFSFQIQDNFHIKKLSEIEPTSLAPTVLYFLDVSKNSTIGGNMSIILNQYFSHECEFKLFCSKLDKHPCGDYKLSIPNQNKDIPICNQKELFSVKMKSELLLNLWYSKKSSYELKCYAWCTPNGDLPPPKLEVPPISNIGILNASQTVVDHSESNILSKMNLYHIPIDIFCPASEKAEMCNYDYTFNWMNIFNGKGSILLKNYEEKNNTTLCEKGGFYFNSSTPMCRENFYYKINIDSKSKLKINVWITPRYTLKTDIILWVTKTGELPKQQINPYEISIDEIVSTMEIY